jgi:1,4-dihydroxy-2-naphthoyl-CoA hydrolase
MIPSRYLYASREGSETAEPIVSRSTVATPHPKPEMPTRLIPTEQTLEGFLKIEWLELTDEIVRAELPVRDDLKQPMGLVHGGIYSAVAESLASVATANAVWRDGFTASGMNNCATFMRPATEGTLHVVCRRRFRAGDRWLWSTEFRDDRDRLCSVVDVTVAVRPLPPGVREQVLAHASQQAS